MAPRVETALVSHLARYGACHRDRRNVATHMIGIPLIVLSIEILLSRPVLPWAGLALTPALAVAAAATLFYLRLDRAFGLAMAALLSLGAWVGIEAAALPTRTWALLGAGLFVAGWAFQFAGHFWERRRPAFVDDLASLLIGPLFVLAELAFAIGLRPAMRQAVEEATAARH